jgi:hypothetical protein
MSKAGVPVPMFLPDYSSSWYDGNKKLQRHIEVTTVDNPANFRREMTALLASNEIIHELSDDDSDADELSDSENDNEDDIQRVHSAPESAQKKKQPVKEWNLLGLMGFKIKNENETIQNIMVKFPPEHPLEIADFDSKARAHKAYSYASSIRKSKTRSADQKSEMKHWINTMMPPRPVDKDSGFLPGAAALWFRKKHGESYELSLPRLLTKMKNPQLRRPMKDDYFSSNQLTENDQKVVDSLPTIELFTATGKNIGTSSCIT